MLFNSPEFALFLPIVFLLYWFLSPSHAGKGSGPRYSLFNYIEVSEKTSLRLQNGLIVIASYIFYGYWDWRFLLLIAFTSLCSYASGLLISNANVGGGYNKHDIRRHKLINHKFFTPKFWMWVNIVINLSILGLFKYYDFFICEFGLLFGINTDGLLLKIILPVGISFYTFQALSYSIDVYRGKIEPTHDIVAFFAFISFFPQLVAGPIERATNLLPQFLHKRSFSYNQAADGVHQIVWGLFKKIVIADNCASYVDQVWSAYSTQSSSTLLLAAVLFTFQIYGDFSGYSDIAIGTSKMFGISLMRNFNNPYFSRDIAEFWRRWHISLTTWFRDYVYIPLGGSRPDMSRAIARYGDTSKHVERQKKLIIVRNTFIIFLLSGFWHGANWTFIAWGAYHALLFLPLILLGKNRKYTNQVGIYKDNDGIEHLRLLPTLCECLQIILTFALVIVGWIIFRSQTISQAWGYITHCFSTSLFTMPLMIVGLKRTLFFTVVMLIIEWFSRKEEHALRLLNLPRWLRILIVYLFVVCMLEFAGHIQSFIYFQF